MDLLVQSIASHRLPQSSIPHPESPCPPARQPNTTSAVVRSLTAARDAWSQFPENRLITPAHWAKIDPADPASLLTRLLKEAGDVPLALAAQAPLTDSFGKLLARLTLHVSHFHHGLDLAIDRGVIPAASRAFYDRDLTATTLPCPAPLRK